MSGAPAADAPGAASAARFTGLVVASFRRHFAVRTDAGETIECVLKGRSLTLACGDQVRGARTQGGGAIDEVAAARGRCCTAPTPGRRS